jgi:hypothetical protein
MVTWRRFTIELAVLLAFFAAAWYRKGFDPRLLLVVAAYFPAKWAALWLTSKVSARRHADPPAPGLP